MWKLSARRRASSTRASIRRRRRHSSSNGPRLPRRRTTRQSSRRRDGTRVPSATTPSCASPPARRARVVLLLYLIYILRALALHTGAPLSFRAHMRHAAHRATTGSTWRARPGAAAQSVDESAVASLRIPIGLCQRRANLGERLSLDGVGHTRLRHGNHFLHKLVDGESLQPPSLDELLALRLELVAPAAFDEPASELRLEPAGSSGHHGWQVGRRARARL